MDVPLSAHDQADWSGMVGWVRGLFFSYFWCHSWVCITISEVPGPGIVQNWCELHGIWTRGQVVFELVNILQLHRPNHILWKMNAASALLCSLYIRICFNIGFPLLHSSPSVAFPLSPPPPSLTVEICNIVEVSLGKIWADYAPTLWPCFSAVPFQRRSAPFMPRHIHSGSCWTLQN